MTSIPKRALMAAALAAAVAGLSATAIAQNAPAPAATQQAQEGAKEGQRDAKRAERMARMQKHMAERQAALKAELKITAQQEPAWNAFVARTAPEARPARQGPREDWSKLTTPERLDKMAAMKAERDTRMSQRHEAIKSFYAALDAEQKKVFDAQQMQGFQRAGMKGHGKKHHHGGGHHRMGGTV
ncbi:Spy/CpxP family protein refolding chaperone [Hydrogenophaga sp.]|uniref:Spy/CpxP family protein refolding chaperone n=1 Tax=Hydrogenophaga sp. TaxID=1904254 RepID=UPI00261C44B1|nr:Spy/CpxP family protein refolding chaperone [Hydrogenophaga sp.]